MSPLVYELFDKITSNLNIKGAVLEIGALDGIDCLLNLPAFEEASEKIGVNLLDQNPSGTNRYININANDLCCFKDGYFQVVISNATLEHDPYFWKSISEMKRVTASGGLVIIGVPGYAGMGVGAIFPERHFIHRCLRFFARLLKKNILSASTLTLGEHLFPQDYYRFSQKAVREVFFDELHDVKIYTVMNPPRFVGIGRKL